MRITKKSILERIKKMGKNPVQPEEINNVNEPLTEEHVKAGKTGELCPVCQGSGLEDKVLKGAQAEKICQNCEGSGIVK